MMSARKTAAPIEPSIPPEGIGPAESMEPQDQRRTAAFENRERRRAEGPAERSRDEFEPELPASEMPPEIVILDPGVAIEPEHLNIPEAPPRRAKANSARAVLSYLPYVVLFFVVATATAALVLAFG